MTKEFKPTGEEESLLRVLREKEFKPLEIKDAITGAPEKIAAIIESVKNAKKIAYLHGDKRAEITHGNAVLEILASKLKALQFQVEREVKGNITKCDRRPYVKCDMSLADFEWLHTSKRLTTSSIEDTFIEDPDDRYATIITLDNFLLPVRLRGQDRTLIFERNLETGDLVYNKD